MNIENIPQVGSKWQIENRVVEVTSVKKRGRGYRVVTDAAYYRLRDFLKVAKPA